MDPVGRMISVTSFASAAPSQWAEDTPKCQNPSCNAKFTLVVRRHHCRVCGQCVCNKCSPNRLQLDGHAGPQRVCTPCVRGQPPEVDAILGLQTSGLQKVSEIGELEARVQQKDSEIAALRALVAQRAPEAGAPGAGVRREDPEVAALEAQVAALEARVQQQDSEAAALEAQVQQRDSEVRALEAQARQRDSEVAALEARARQRDSETAELGAQVQQRDSEIRALESQVQQKDSDIAALEARARRRGSGAEAPTSAANALKSASSPAQLPIAARRGAAAGAAGGPEAGELDGPPSPGSAVARDLTPMARGGGREADDGEFGLAASQFDEVSRKQTIIRSMTRVTLDTPEADDTYFGISKCQLEEAGRRPTVHEEVVLEQVSQLAERLPAFLGALAGVMNVEVPRLDHESDTEACEKTMSSLEGVFPELERRLQVTQ